MARRPDLGLRLTALGLAPRLDEPLAKHGFWRIGGPADALVDVPTLDQLRGVLRLGEPVLVLGRGSNLLVADAGVRGIVVRLAGEFLASEFAEGPDGAMVRAGAGLANAVLLKRIEDRGLSGLAPLVGVPGTVGGAIRMNAGSSLGEIASAVREVGVALPGGEVRTMAPADLRFGYRRAEIPAGGIVTSVRFALRREESASERAAIAEFVARRKATQPLDLPSCGSVFKNPPEDHAARLVEAAGLKGTRRGGAEISAKHANFIVNLGCAAATDVYALVVLARETVWRKFGVLLEPEVHAVGEWPDGAWPLPPPR